MQIDPGCVKQGQEIQSDILAAQINRLTHIDGVHMRHAISLDHRFGLPVVPEV